MNFLQVIKNRKSFYLGSNGRLIEKKKDIKELPFIFGEFKNKDFFKLFKVINNNKFDYNQIKNLFYYSSGRWDIETHSGMIIKLPRDELNESMDLTMRILNQNDFNQINILQFNTS